MSENTINITARIKIKPESLEEAKKEMSNLVNMTRQENGCITYDLLQATKDETSFFIYEVWESREDLAKHSESAHFKSWNEKSQSMMAEPGQITFWKKAV